MPSPAPGTQAVDRAVDLVARVVRADGGVSFTTLCERSGLARSTTSRLLTALERGGLLLRDVDGDFLPGPLFERYAARRDHDALLAEAARPELLALAERTRETINLAVPRGGTVVQVDQVDSDYLLGSRDWVGVSVPAHTSALGKVCYAWGGLALPQGDLARPTPATLTASALARALPEIRARGWASTVDELEPGLTGVAAPVLVDGALVAALGVSGPTSRLAGVLTATGSVVADHARVLSARLHTTGPRGAGSRKDGAA